jgi:hypothetical protein
MPWVEFESTIPAFERAKIVHALAVSATWPAIGIGYRCAKTLDLPSVGHNISSSAVDALASC